MAQQITWDQTDCIIHIISTSTSRQEVIGRMGYHNRDARQIGRLNVFIVTNSVNIDHFRFIPPKWRRLPDIIAECFCYADVLRKLGLSEHGNNTNTAKKFIEYYKLDISHFSGNRFGNSVPKYTDDVVFNKNKSINKSTVRKRFIKLVDYECSMCGLVKWNNEHITLEMDHIDGDRNNHEVTNLRLLCPNCHSQN